VSDRPLDDPSRDFTVAVFVVHDHRVLLHYHQKLGRWLPPGGHIDPNELPDEAAAREVFEETGVLATLIGAPALAIDDPSLPRQLTQPAGIQLEDISPGHQHIDFVYFASGSPAEPRQGVGWHGPADWAALELTAEVAAWCDLANRSVSGLAPG
jgi:8-oxo-dGTP pyrophosphatase MutT (NUDIX family)